jgi:hypothetical protein
MYQCFSPNCLPQMTAKNDTQAQDLEIPLGFLRACIEFEIGGKLHRGTWSSWCRRFLNGPVRADRRVDLNIAASLWTFSALHLYGCRSYSGPAYKKLYPLSYQRIQEICNVQ